MAEHYRAVKVLVEQTYLLPVSGPDAQVTEINGWTAEQVCQDWFAKHNLNSSHATRDSYCSGVKALGYSIAKEVES